MKTRGYSSTVSSTSALNEDRVDGQQHASATLRPGMILGTHFTGGRVTLGTGLGRRGEIAPPTGFELRPVQLAESRTCI